MPVRFFSFLSFFLFTFAINAQVHLISPNSLIRKISQSTPSDKVMVFNFWATWCKPCVQELPYFNTADSLLQGDGVSFIFVSFDSPSAIKKVRKFIKSKKITGTHYLLDAVDLNEFITSVDTKWQGNIPYTIVLKNGTRINHENSFENLKELLLFIK